MANCLALGREGYRSNALNQPGIYPVNSCNHLLQAQTMNNPFEQISAAFAPEYRVNLSIERLDGSIMLTLSDDAGVVAKRLITQAQRNDPVRLQRVIDSIRLGLAIELGQNPLQVLAALTRDPRQQPGHSIAN
ncbi:hypothetical protein BR1R5_47580 [Pseudomonas sp. BR1R-5]|nr:hypothetical protein BR1R5_47580 [Pseudomonas sp. BR1R-5]